MSNNVICYSFDANKTVQQSILEILETERDIELKNKYYESTIHLFDGSKYNRHDLGSICQAIIFYANGQTLTTGLLEEQVEQFNWVGDGPRIIVCDHIDDDCPSYKTFLEWSIKNEFEMILAEEGDLKKQIIDSLSAFHWPNMTTKSEDDQEKELMDFETMLNKMKAIKDLPPETRSSKLADIQDLLARLMSYEDQDSDLET